MSSLSRACLVLAALCAASCASHPKPSPPLSPAAAPAVSPVASALTGPWHGAVEAGPQRIGLDLTLTERGATVEGTLDVREQGLRGLPLEQGTREGAAVRFQARLPSSQAIAFEGTLEGDVLRGTFSQGPAKLPFVLQRGLRAEVKRATSGDGFREEEVTFHNGEVKLAGTLTLPTAVARPPVAVLITGSGPQDRNEEVFGFRLFEALAHALAKGGVATLRYDDRGVGQSTGEFLGATTADFATDVEAAVRFLAGRPEVDPGRIGLIGHSEGALVAPMVAGRRPREGLAFVVLLAAPAQRMDALLLEQIARVGRSEGKGADAIEREVSVNRRALALLALGKDLSSMEEELYGLCQMGCEPKDAWLRSQRWNMENRWFRFLATYDPAPALRKLRTPVLALGGTLDVQVPSDLNLPLLRQLLGGSGRKGKVEVVELEGVNHVLQKAKTGAVSEYAKLPKELAPEVPAEILRWLGARGLTATAHLASERGLKD